MALINHQPQLQRPTDSTSAVLKPEDLQADSQSFLTEKSPFVTFQEDKAHIFAPCSSLAGCKPH